MKDFNIRKTKLIIWDLDDTFWKGNLVEGTATFDMKKLNFLEELVTKGIMNSICSKNELDDVKKFFIEQGFEKYWNYFIFPSVNWLPKGERVKELIKNAGLREENVIFIDDNEINISEVKYYCPNIMTAFPEQIRDLMAELYTVNDYDFEHTRLAQYKILEQKTIDKTTQNISNDEFLRQSNIEIAIKKDCAQNTERLYKMILRTNQLNFTKNRITEDELARDINNPDYESAYIAVQDNYGSYGICGFYTLDKTKNKLVHFLFSCRILSMGIEQFIYSHLGFPDIDIQGETASELSKTETPDWIKIVDDIKTTEQKRNFISDTNILFKGTCDFLSVIDYINEKDSNITTELPYWNKNLVYILGHTHTAFIEQTHRKSIPELLALTKQFPYPQMDEFKTTFFDRKYNLIFLSMLSASYSGLYVNKKTGDYAIFGFANCDITDEKNWESVLAGVPENMREQNLVLLKAFKEEYEFAGNPPTEHILKNLKYIRENLDTKTHLVLILGSEIDTEKYLRGYEGLVHSHIAVNPEIEKFAKDYDNITTYNLTKLIRSDEDYTTCLNHFARRVYIDMAEDFIRIANEKLGKDCLQLNTRELNAPKNPALLT